MTRALPEAWRAAAEDAAPPLALAVTLVRSDGLTLGFTDHDAALVIDAVPHRPAAIRINGGVTTFGLDDDAPLVAGVLDDAALRADDLDAGLWDDARVLVRRVDRAAPEVGVTLAVGRLGVVRAAGGAYDVEVLGPKAALARPMGRIFARSCDAVVGDVRCGVDLAAPAFSGAGTVVEIVSMRTIRVDGLDTYADGWFTGGRLTWGGRGVEILAHRREGARAALDVAASPPLGARVIATAGCDKSLSSCRAKFANAANFRGFPHMIGPDALIRGADADGVTDGGSRQ